MSLRPGMRVEYTHYNSASSLARNLHGMKGTVKNGVSPKGRVLVEFDENIEDFGGHSGDNGEGVYGHCLYIKPEYLTLLGFSGTNRVRGCEVQKSVAVGAQKKEDKMSLIKTVGRLARKFIDKELVELIEAGLIDDNFEATQKGVEYAATEYLLSNKAAIAKEIKAARKEEAKRKKGEDTEDEK